MISEKACILNVKLMKHRTDQAASIGIRQTVLHFCVVLEHGYIQ